MPLCCFLRVFLSSRSTLVQREGWRSLWSRVRCTGARFCLLVHSWTRDSGVALLRWTPATYSVPIGSSSSTLHARRGVGEGESSGGFLCSRLPLPPHPCTLGEVVGRVSFLSTAPVRVLPGLPILGWEAGRVFEPALGRLAFVCSLVAHAVAPLSVLGQRSRRCGHGSSRLLFCPVWPLCDRWQSTAR